MSWCQLDWRASSLCAAACFILLNCNKPDASAQGTAKASAVAPLASFHAVAPPLPSAAAPLNAEQELQLKLTYLSASGPAEEALVSAFSKGILQWKAALKKLNVTFSDPQCFRKGCQLELSHPSDLALDEATRLIMTEGTFSDWRAEKFRSGPIASKTRPGRIEATWIFYATEPSPLTAAPSSSVQ